LAEEITEEIMSEVEEISTKTVAEKEVVEIAENGQPVERLTKIYRVPFDSC
jgi:hypothetical protein